MRSGSEIEDDPSLDDEEGAIEPPLENGARLGAYEIAGILGRGGMGIVYEGRHVVLGKRVAIKTMLRRYPADSEVVARFLREARAASIITHPHVADVTDIDVQDGRPFMVMEYLQGQNLTQFMRQGRLTVEQTLDVLLPVISALDAAHAKGIVHRDIKPSNIFLAVDPRGGLPIPKLLDFGIAKVYYEGARDLTRSECLVGTPQYLSPEQACHAKGADHRSDQYSVGVVMYQCLTGQCPFSHDSLYASLRAIVEGIFAPPSELVPDLPPKLERIILKAMNKVPDLRFPTISALADALMPFASARTRVLFWGSLSEPPDGATATAMECLPRSSSTDPSDSEPSLSLAATRDERAPSLPHAAPGRIDRGSDGQTRSQDLWLDEPVTTLSGSAVESPVVVMTKSRGTWFMIAAVVGLAAGGGAVASVLSSPETNRGRTTTVASPPPESPPTTFRFEVAVLPTNASIHLDDRLLGTGNVSGALPIDGAIHTMRIDADGYVSRTIVFRDSFPESAISLERQEPEAPTDQPSSEPTGETEEPAANTGRTSSSRSTRPARLQAPEPPRPSSRGSGIHRGANGSPIVD